jgi:hypothetical protein
MLGGVREALDRESGAEHAGEPSAARGGGLRRGAKCLLWGLAVGAVGYLLGTTVIFLNELTRPDDLKRELLVPLRYAFLVAYFLCPLLSLYGVVRMLYAVVFERRRGGHADRRARARDAEDTSLLDEARAGAAPLPPHQQPTHTPASFMRGGEQRDPEPARLSVTEQTTGLL